MKKPKRIPVNIPLENNGSISDVFQDFINRMQIITGGNVDLDCNLQGNITVYFEGDQRPSNNSNKSFDIEALLHPEHISSRSDEKLLDMGNVSNTKNLRAE